MEPIREQSDKEKIACDIAYNEYVDFLLNVWTPKLRVLGLIPPDDVVNIYNSNGERNNRLLNKLRDLNYNVYDEMASRFIVLKSAIVNNGGSVERS